MLERLGVTRLAYDWRAEHIPTFDAEVAALQRHGIELTAWWFPATLNDEALQAIFDPEIDARKIDKGEGKGFDTVVQL